MAGHTGVVPINIYEAKTHLSELVARAAKGEEFTIAKAGKPLARLVPIPAQKTVRKPGGWEGKVWIADDFDAPLPTELLSAFYGGEIPAWATTEAPSSTSKAAHRTGNKRKGK